LPWWLIQILPYEKISALFGVSLLLYLDFSQYFEFSQLPFPAIPLLINQLPLGLLIDVFYDTLGIPCLSSYFFSISETTLVESQ